jgi:hypothetical protein
MSYHHMAVASPSEPYSDLLHPERLLYLVADALRHTLHLDIEKAKDRKVADASSVDPQNNACRIEHDADLVIHFKLKIFRAFVGNDGMDHIPP